MTLLRQDFRTFSFVMATLPDGVIRYAIFDLKFAFADCAFTGYCIASGRISDTHSIDKAS